MSRENNYQAVVLKKQPYGEADEIITFFTKENGKVRAIAKSLKFAKSKLQYSLQALFLVNLRTAGQGLVKVIGAETLNAFAYIRENFEAVKVVYYTIELIMKFTPDEEKNEELFSSFVDFLEFLNQKNLPGNLLEIGLVKFKIHFLETQGLGIHYPSTLDAGKAIGFSNSRGSFVLGDLSAESVPISPECFRLFQVITTTAFSQLHKELEKNKDTNIRHLQKLLSSFINYQLERDIKSEKYLAM